MRSRIPAAALAAACLAVAATASADVKVGEKNNGLSICEERYLTLYEQAHGKFGPEAVGRNRVDDGKVLANGEVVPEPHPCQLAATLDAMLHPPPPPDPVPVIAPAETDTAYVAPVASGGACPAAYAGESSDPAEPSTGPGDPSGCIQAMPSTWDAYGDPAYADAGDAPVSVQLAAAARICAAQGNAAWTAADPC